MLKPWIAFLPWFLALAVLIEALDRKARTIGTGLTGLRVELFDERGLLGKDRAVALQIVGGGMLVHPLAQALVANELHNADRFIDGSILLFVASQLVLVDQHASCFLLSDMVLLYRKYCCMSSGESDETNQFLL